MRSHLEAAAKAAAEGDQLEAQKCLRRANEGFVNLPMLFSLAGRVRRNAGDFYGAIEAYNSALIVSPQHMPALFGRALAKEEIDDYEGAIADFDIRIATAQQPSLEQAYFRRGMVHWKLGDKRRAEDDLRSSIRINPSYSSPYGYLGALLRYAGKLEESLTACDKAISLSPDDVRPYNTRLWTRYALGQSDLAMADATKCMELMPENGQYVLYRALLHELMGEFAGAEKDYARTIELAEQGRDNELWFYAHAYRDLLRRSRSAPPRNCVSR